MKKLFRITFLVGIFLLVGFAENHYTMDCKVIKTEKNGVVVEDPTGNMWAFDNEKSYIKGDNVKVLFNCNGTEDYRIDDKIVKVW